MLILTTSSDTNLNEILSRFELVLGTAVAPAKRTPSESRKCVLVTGAGRLQE